jgi:hypothetical protein
MHLGDTMSGVIHAQDDADVTARAGRSRVLARARFAVLMVALMCSLGAVLASPLLGVSNGSDPLDVRYGMPIPWVHQDQSSLAPPRPSQAGFVSPWEYPTSFSTTVFVVDVVLVFAAVLAVLALLVLASRQLRPPR